MIMIHGPRQSGKTTRLLAMMAEKQYVDVKLIVLSAHRAADQPVPGR